MTGMEVPGMTGIEVPGNGNGSPGMTGMEVTGMTGMEVPGGRRSQMPSAFHDLQRVVVVRHAQRFRAFQAA